MSFRGGRGGGNRGSRGGGGNFRGGRGGARGGPGRREDFGPPEEVTEFGEFSHECEGQLVVNATIDKIPFFNAPVYLKNITQIGKIDEILGPIKGYIVSVQLNENYKATSFENGQKMYIDPRKLLPLDRFLPKPPVPKDQKRKRKSGGAQDGDKGQFKRFKEDRGGGSNRGRFERGGGNFGGNRDRNSFGGNRERSFGSSGGERGSFRGGRGSFRGGRGSSSFRGRGRGY